VSSPGALELIEAVLDPGSWRRWDAPLPPEVGADPAYAEALAAARQRTGLDEAVVTGEGRIRGRRVAVVACEFGFLAGSIGVRAADRLVTAVERATDERLPLLASPTSGGTRMQEGTTAFLQMVKITAAIGRHKAAGNPYLVYLRNPTTGGVLASWGSLGHVTVAEPGALIGFLGPRVYSALYGGEFPAGVQTAENLLAHGIVDAVLPPEAIPEILDRALAVLSAPREGSPDAAPVDPADDAFGCADGDAAAVDDIPAWESVRRSRRPERPGVRQLLRSAARDVVPMRGTGAGEIDAGLILALARFGGAPCVVLGQDRQNQAAGTQLGPAGLREARRGMKLADELKLPLVTVIDTAGAALSKEAEEGGLAGEIARCLQDLVLLDAPTVCLLLGEGAGGGALALLPADRVVCAQHGWLSPLPPEGASAIMHRTTDRAAEMAEAQGVRSLDLLRAGIVDRVVAERPDAADEPAAYLARVARVLEAELAGLLRRDPQTRLAARLARYRTLGSVP
jgi:acetyl-CoA carboxylase alpha subunit/acetyl-CoA carboxylase beta subunit